MAVSHSARAALCGQGDILKFPCHIPLGALRAALSVAPGSETGGRLARVEELGLGFPTPNPSTLKARSVLRCTPRRRPRVLRGGRRSGYQLPEQVCVGLGRDAVVIREGRHRAHRPIQRCQSVSLKTLQPQSSRSENY